MALAATIGVPGIMHFVAPTFFDSVVPKWMPGSKRTVTYVSGVVELASAALTLAPSTRKIGAWMCFATFIGVYPANIQMALDGGIADAPPSALNSSAAAWIRLPLQFPMILSAWRVAREN